MSQQPVLQRHPSLRWLAPLGLAAVLVAVLIDNIDTSGDTSPLPLVSASTLVDQVRGPHPQFAGTVVASLSQGAGVLAALSPDTSFATMEAGSHSLRVWYGGPTLQRVAAVGALSETDVFRSGTQLWQWNSADRTAVRSRATALMHSFASIATSPASLTPLDLAEDALGAAKNGTTVSVAGGERVADREAYGLVLRPRSTDTLVDYVYIAVDGVTKTPLAVQVFARGSGDPAIDVAFTSIRFARQAASTFRFAPPDGATIRNESRPSTARVSVSTHGRGWTSVACYRGTGVSAKQLPTGAVGAVAPRTVKGGWGKGRLLQLSLLSVLVTDDGRLYVGAVAPHVLYAAAR